MDERNEPLLTRNDMIGWGLAIVVVVVMGIIAFTGPYHKVNKPAVASTLPPVKLKIVSDPVIIGRYTPRTVTVHLNQKVEWQNVSNAPHTVTSDDGKSFNSGTIAIGATWTFIPRKAGRFTYYCSFHPHMHGVLVVTA